MNLAQVCRLLAQFVALFTALQLVPLAFAWWVPQAGGYATAGGFLLGLAAGTATTALLWLAGRRAQGTLFRREMLAVAGFSWLLAGVLGAIPLQWSGVLPHAVDALFECVSGLTTFGGSVLGSGGNPAPEQTPQAILFWRALLHWIGGLGIVMLFSALLAPGRGGRSLLTAESVAIETEADQPSALSHSRTLLGVYVGLSAACALALLLAGMGPFDAVCHSFATIATGGFSTRSSIAAFDSLPVELVLTAFMFLGGASFIGLGAMLRGGLWHETGLLHSPEFRTYCAVVAVVVLAVTVSLVRAGLAPAPALQQAAFNVVSIVSCTGFATVDMQAWPQLAIALLLFCMLIGGCSGSAAGGMKQIRLLVCLKLVAHTMRRFVRPRSIERIRLAGEPLAEETIASIVAVVLLWLLTVGLGTAVLALDGRLDPFGALTTSASTLANVGPAFGVVEPASAAAALAGGGAPTPLHGHANVGPFGGYGDLAAGSKLWMCLQMVLGRLELLTPLALFSPTLWRRR